MNTFTIVIPAYNNDNALFDLLSSLEESNTEFNVIVVLDGYKSKLKFTDFDLHLSVYRIRKDIKWNQPQAKNLGAYYAKTNWIYFIDIDLIPTLESLDWISCTSLDIKSIYFPSRKTTNGKRIDNAKGSYLVSKYAHIRLRGFDERFCGHYGHDDSYYIWKHERLMNGNIVRNSELETFVNMSYGTKLPRNTTRNNLLMKQLQRSKKITDTFHLQNIDFKKIL